MKNYYDDKKDLLYIRFEDGKKEVLNKRITEYIVIDVEDEGKIIGIEIMDASKHLYFQNRLPVNTEFEPISDKVRYKPIEKLM